MVKFEQWILKLLLIALSILLIGYLIYFIIFQFIFFTVMKKNFEVIRLNQDECQKYFEENNMQEFVKDFSKKTAINEELLKASVCIAYHFNENE